MQTAAATTGFRFIDIDWRDHTAGPPVWRLKVDGQLVATAAVRDWTEPPFALTEGLPFVAQYHSATSAMAGEPDSWVYRPTPRRSAFGPLLVAFVAATLAITVWKPAVLLAVALFVALVASETRRPGKMAE